MTPIFSERTISNCTCYNYGDKQTRATMVENLRAYGLASAGFRSPISEARCGAPGITRYGR